jgi:aerobic-type carbon monoxide dehydrogenase small subunit (CoxS/CutS family)
MRSQLHTGAALASASAAPTPATINIILNGAAPQPITVPDQTVPLLYILRNILGLKGPKFGCGFGQCGACESYLPDFGQPARTCQATVAKLFAYYAVYHIPTYVPLKVITLEGLGTTANPHPLQSAFVDQQAGQCAYCANAMIIGAYGFLHGRFAAGNTNVPTDAEVKDFYSNSTFTDPTTNPPNVIPTPYLCRCGAHLRFIRAVQAATPAVMTRFANGLI